MRRLPVANPALAKKIWASMPNPSTRRVARKLGQAGLATSHETINRWRRQGWRHVEPVAHPLDAARAALDGALPIVSGDPLTTVDSLIGDKPDLDSLSGLSDNELVRRAIRQLAMASITVANAMMRQPGLVLTRPAAVGTLFRALAACAQAMTTGLIQTKTPQAAAPKVP